MKMTTKEYISKNYKMRGYIRLTKQSRKEYLYDKYIVEMANKEKYIIKYYNFKLNPEKNFLEIKKISDKKYEILKALYFRKIN